MWTCPTLQQQANVPRNPPATGETVARSADATTDRPRSEEATHPRFGRQAVSTATDLQPSSKRQTT